MIVLEWLAQASACFLYAAGSVGHQCPFSQPRSCASMACEDEFGKDTHHHNCPKGTLTRGGCRQWRREMVTTEPRYDLQGGVEESTYTE